MTRRSTQFLVCSLLLTASSASARPRVAARRGGAETASPAASRRLGRAAALLTVGAVLGCLGACATHPDFVDAHGDVVARQPTGPAGRITANGREWTADPHRIVSVISAGDWSPLRGQSHTVAGVAELKSYLSTLDVDTSGTKILVVNGHANVEQMYFGTTWSHGDRFPAPGVDPELDGLITTRTPGGIAFYGCYLGANGALMQSYADAFNRAWANNESVTWREADALGHYMWVRSADAPR